MNKNGFWDRREAPSKIGTPTPPARAALLAVLLAGFASVSPAEEFAGMPDSVAASDAGNLVHPPGLDCATPALTGEEIGADPANVPEERFLRWAIAAHRQVVMSPRFRQGAESRFTSSPGAGTSPGAASSAAAVDRNRVAGESPHVVKQ